MQLENEQLGFDDVPNGRRATAWKVHQHRLLQVLRGAEQVANPGCSNNRSPTKISKQLEAGHKKRQKQGRLCTTQWDGLKTQEPEVAQVGRIEINERINCHPGGTTACAWGLMKALTNWRTIADVNDNTFALLCNEVMFATSGVGLQEQLTMSWMKQGLGNDQEAADPKTLQTISGFPHRHWVHSCAPTTASVQAIMELLDSKSAVRCKDFPMLLFLLMEAPAKLLQIYTTHSHNRYYERSHNLQDGNCEAASGRGWVVVEFRVPTKVAEDASGAGVTHARSALVTKSPALSMVELHIKYRACNRSLLYHQLITSWYISQRFETQLAKLHKLLPEMLFNEQEEWKKNGLTDPCRGLSQVHDTRVLDKQHKLSLWKRRNANSEAESQCRGAVITHSAAWGPEPCQEPELSLLPPGSLWRHFRRDSVGSLGGNITALAQHSLQGSVETPTERTP
ncbi:hypothetical protein Anapl_15204 [Anas platyrhynchos]|uniref:Uncharacterized protein n=1 Tax=Anas platyrhynchos TaxID=8839 RepID=R0L3M8_ANAPL|nr:hypothetical protein Anapl_15204 [Anas platyrhynchos]